MWLRLTNPFSRTSGTRAAASSEQQQRNE